MPTFILLKKISAVFTAMLLLVSLGLSAVETAQAAVVNPSPQAKVSFTFDDGGSSTLLKAAPTLAQYGYTGTSYITTSCVGKTTVPNNCPADTGIPYMTWSQIKTLQNSYGWEIGSHSVSHPLLTEINSRKLEQEVANSKATLVAQGINPTSFATPYGDWNDKVLAAIAKHYSNHRPFHDTGYNAWPYNNYVLRVQQVQMGVDVDVVKTYIDRAAADNTWLILVFHDIQDKPSTDPEDYQFSTTDLDAVAAYVKNKNLAVTNVTNGLVSAGPQDNLLANPIQGSVIGNGWLTDAPTLVKPDSTTRGNYPEARTSVKMTSSNKNIHLFSPQLAVKSTNSYAFKGYANISSRTAGEVGFYIDEYDANGNWVSGQWKQALNSLLFKDISFSYTPTSNLVAKASLQVYVTAGSGITVYIDNLQWLTTFASAEPEPQPIVNLLDNGTFELGLHGWHSDSTGITLDGGNNGAPANPKNSVKLSNRTDKNTHLFASPIAVNSTESYIVSAYMNMITLGTGDFGFYIDEYDANGNWISGQYLYTKADVSNGTIRFEYKPTSISVAQAGLQVIAAAGTTSTAYIDDVLWLQK